MKTFHLTYTLVKSYYMEDSSSNQLSAQTAIVEAESEDLAKKTLVKYWDNKSDPYSISYDARDIGVSLHIKQIDILKDEDSKED